jgi:hypothetical protein
MLVAVDPNKHVKKPPFVTFSYRHIRSNQRYQGKQVGKARLFATIVANQLEYPSNRFLSFSLHILFRSLLSSTPLVGPIVSLALSLRLLSSSEISQFFGTKAGTFLVPQTNLANIYKCLENPRTCSSPTPIIVAPPLLPFFYTSCARAYRICLTKTYFRIN